MHKFSLGILFPIPIILKISIKYVLALQASLHPESGSWASFVDNKPSVRCVNKCLELATLIKMSTNNPIPKSASPAAKAWLDRRFKNH